MSNVDSTFPVNPLKRRRTEHDSSSNASTPEISKNTRFWFEDGNIALQAEDTQFRVHRGVMARHSVVFRDMLLIAHPETGSVDGCPVVSLADDAAHDWIHVLGIIYDNEIFYQTSEILSIPLIGAMLRLGRKYQFDTLYTSALARLKKDIPTTLEGWDASMGDTWREEYTEDFDLLNLLEDFRIQTLLPTVYYYCAIEYNLDEIMDGIQRNDGTTARLSHASAKQILKGKMKMANAVERYMINAFRALPLQNVCASCIDLQARLFLRHSRNNLISIFLPRPSDLFLKRSEITAALCVPCKDRMCSLLESKRRLFWDSLPELFGLPSWTELSDTPCHTSNQPS
ncbi:hypothetical protein JR316_0000283 [Psilocybe cubensis]|uniref:BTB domain-containing protein n=2 Tax=Psilocybe cubensis TaxID=181762 RepID=A0A8H7Y4K0_PSICU|nr:hypothetical protein JR316_0000283 [Psilocybe cubensis]KAH9486219.1 hypothetical protein JR316_0000283 [Psilocybe cubensis]